MCYAIEIYIHEKKIDPKKITAIWFMGKLVSNKFLAKKWSEQILILPRHILEPIYFFFNSFKIFSFFIFNYDEESDAVKRTLKDKLKRLDDKNVLLKYGVKMLLACEARWKLSHCFCFRSNGVIDYSISRSYQYFQQHNNKLPKSRRTNSNRNLDVGLHFICLW